MKEGVLKYLKISKTIYNIVNFVLIVGIVITFFLTTLKVMPFVIFAVLFFVADVALRIAYNLKIALTVVYGIEINHNQLVLCTNKQKYSYNVSGDCKEVIEKNNKYVCIFISGGVREKFIFYKHAPFTSFTDDAFTKEDIRLFYEGL